MKTQRIVAALAAASLVTSGATFAQSTGAQDQAQQRDNQGRFIADPGPNRIDENGRFRGPTQGIRQAERARTDQQRADQQRADQQRADQQRADQQRADQQRADQQRANRRDDRNDRRDYRGDQRDYRGDQRDYRIDRRDYRNDVRGYGYRDGYRDGYRGEGRGAGPEHSWYRGDRLPYRWRDRSYVIDDWHNHHLNAPPRGYQWVQAGSDYVLVAIATGIIASILLNQ